VRFRLYVDYVELSEHGDYLWLLLHNQWRL
jgi:hypothetical protein